jgi:hypothetical protein
MFESEKINVKNQNFTFFQFVSNHCINVYLSCINWESYIIRIFPKFKIFEMKFGHGKKFDLTNQNTCEKFFKNNAHIYAVFTNAAFADFKKDPPYTQTNCNIFLDWLSQIFRSFEAMFFNRVEQKSKFILLQAS